MMRRWYHDVMLTPDKLQPEIKRKWNVVHENLQWAILSESQRPESYCWWCDQTLIWMTRMVHHWGRILPEYIVPQKPKIFRIIKNNQEYRHHTHITEGCEKICCIVPRKILRGKECKCLGWGASDVGCFALEICSPALRCSTDTGHSLSPGHSLVELARYLHKWIYFSSQLHQLSNIKGCFLDCVASCRYIHGGGYQSRNFLSRRTNFVGNPRIISMLVVCETARMISSNN